jgi:N-acetylglucosamine malate deacetylase 1
MLNLETHLANHEAPLAEPPLLEPPLLEPKQLVRVMAIFAHPDDEIGCVGTLSKHSQAGGAVKLIWLTRGELASQFGTSSSSEVAHVRNLHAQWVATTLGCDYTLLDFPDAGLTGGRNEALSLARLIAAWKPDRIITWHPFDVHPDHRATHWAVLSALKLARIPKLVGEAYRKPVRLYHYVSPDLPRPLVHVDISSAMTTLEAIYTFYQQTYQWPWTLEDLRQSREAMGLKAGLAYAECFQEAHLKAVEGLPA